jgi:heme/copper-type cytochrome/quinol oxidase subunit 2
VLALVSGYRFSMTTPLRKSSLVISASLFAVALFSAPMAFGASYASSKPGATCLKAGSLTKSGSTSLTCIKSGKKLVWQIVKTTKPITPKPSVTPSTTPTISALPAQSAYNITVASSQWNFEFTYFVDGSKSARHSASGDSSILYIPESKLVHFTLTSADTTHGFWIPGLSIDSSMDPGVTGHLDFTPNKTGTFPGRCNVSSCGRGHAGMAFTVKVVSDGDFLKYLSSLK